MMLTIHVTHRSDASSAVKSHSADADLFWSSVTELKERIDAHLRRFDHERHHWVVLVDARAQLASYLRYMETVYRARVEMVFETDEERAAREEDEERLKAEQEGEAQEERQATEEEEERRRSGRQRQTKGTKKRPHTTGRQRRTRKQRSTDEPLSPFNRRMNAGLAYATLHLTPDAPEEMIQAAWRTLAKIHHPDVGGDATMMARINDAYRFLQDAFKQRVDAA